MNATRLNKKKKKKKMKRKMNLHARCSAKWSSWKDFLFWKLRLQNKIQNKRPMWLDLSPRAHERTSRLLAIQVEQPICRLLPCRYGERVVPHGWEQCREIKFVNKPTWLTVRSGKWVQILRKRRFGLQGSTSTSTPQRNPKSVVNWYTYYLAQL
jgi:hypothetical protein